MIDGSKFVGHLTVHELEYLLDQRDKRLLDILADKITRSEAMMILEVGDRQFNNLIRTVLTPIKEDGKVRFSRKQVLEYRDKKGRKIKRTEI